MLLSNYLAGIKLALDALHATNRSVNAIKIIIIKHQQEGNQLELPNVNKSKCNKIMKTNEI